MSESPVFDSAMQWPDTRTCRQGGSHGSMIMVRADLDDILEIEDVMVQLPRHEVIGIQIKANAFCTFKAMYGILHDPTIFSSWTVRQCFIKGKVFL